MNLPLRLLVNTFACFNRRELVLLSTATRRFDRIVEKHFSKAPYLRLAFLYYSYKNGWKWHHDHSFLHKYQTVKDATALTMSEDLSTKLPTTTFLRFQASRFIFKHDPMDLLRKISHVWQNGALNIELAGMTPPNELLGLVWACHSLWFAFEGSLTNFSELFRDSNLVCLCLDDTTFSSVKQLPLDDIVHYLFKKPIDKANLRKENHLSIETWYSADAQNYMKIVNSIHQKFLDTADPPIFRFTILNKARLEWNNEQNFDLDHPRAKKHICFKTYKNGFRIECQNISGIHNSIQSV